MNKKVKLAETQPAPPDFENFAYTVLEAGVRIDAYINRSKGLNTFPAVTIPATIDNLPVVEIGEKAFQGSDVTSVNIPDSVTSIGTGAFSECVSLEAVSIPDSVTKIGISAFSGCTSLKSINIPISVTNIAPSVFSGCTSLKFITVNSKKQMGHDAWISDSVTKIYSEAFSGCSSLELISLPEGIKIDASAFQDCPARIVYRPAIKTDEEPKNV